MSGGSNQAKDPRGLESFIEAPSFSRQWARLGLVDHDLLTLQITLLDDPTAGVVVAGTNGVRKLRFAVTGSGKGKSGAYRVFYLNLPEHGRFVLWGVIDKTDDANLTPADRAALAAQVANYKSTL